MKMYGKISYSVTGLMPSIESLKERAYMISESIKLFFNEAVYFDWMLAERKSVLRLQTA